LSSGRLSKLEFFGLIIFHVFLLLCIWLNIPISSVIFCILFHLSFAPPGGCSRRARCRRTFTRGSCGTRSGRMFCPLHFDYLDFFLCCHTHDMAKYILMYFYIYICYVCFFDSLLCCCLLATASQVGALSHRARVDSAAQGRPVHVASERAAVS
jgi:hypothetical protein